MAAFGITFPKLTLCRSTTPKVDTNTTSTPPPPTTTSTSTPPSTRTLSLSIKNVPSQPLHYDISTTTASKKKPISIATILAIDGETKQLPKNLSVFNELQLDDEAEDINEKRKREENSSAVIVPSLSSPMRAIHQRADIRFSANTDSKKVSDDSKNEEKLSLEQRHSNHTFTPPTSSLSHNSSSNDLHLTSSSLSVDLPQLKYAIEKFLVDDDDDPIYQVIDEFPSGCSLLHQEHDENIYSSNITQSDRVSNTNVHSMHEKNTNHEASSRPTAVSNSMKWYVSELRIHRPLIYQTQWTNEQLKIPNRKFSHSVNDLKHIYNFSSCPKTGQIRKENAIIYSTLSLQNFLNQPHYHHQSDDNILLRNHVSSTDEDLNHPSSNEDDQYLFPSTQQRTIDRSVGRADTLIRNESVKKKLFDILNDDELENACLEDMSQEFEKISPIDHHRNLQTLNSFSSSSDDALYSSPPTEPYHLLLPTPPLPLSSSCNEILSANTNNTTERYFGRSRLITTSLDKIPMNNNNAYDYSSSTCLLRPSYERTRPSWYTSPSPHWHMDDQLPMVSVLKGYSSRNDDYLNGINPNRLLNTKVSEYDLTEKRNIQKYHHHHHRKEQKHIGYSLMHGSTSLVENSTTVLPIIQDKSSNLLMFI